MIGTVEDIVGDLRFQEGSAWKRHQFHPNQIVIREGEQGHSLYFIEEGTLRVSGRVELEQHRHVQPGICDLVKGDVFGELCLFKSQRRTATVMTLTEANILELDGDRLRVYLDAHPARGVVRDACRAA